MNKDPTSMLSFILGNDSILVNEKSKPIQKINRKLILSSAMFWDSKKRIQKIKSLFINSLGLVQFEDSDDFKVHELQSIELLSISKNKIIHLQPISHLNTLVSLNISFNRVYDLNPISKLQKLEELYASHNQIKSIEPLKQLIRLKILQVYKNKIHDFKDIFETLSNIPALSELDIEQNPVGKDSQFIDLISTTFSNLKKLNNQLNKSVSKIKEMSSSKGFMNTSGKGFGTSSMFFTATSSFVNNDAQKTFYDFCKKKSLTSKSYEKRREKENILSKLEAHYKELDEQFQKEIVKNVRIKNRLHKLIENRRNMQSEKQDKSHKKQEIKQLKRKVKGLKEQLFTKDKKGELLRKLFQVEVAVAKGKLGNQMQEKKLKSISQGEVQLKRLAQVKNEIRWTRRFEADEVIIVEGNSKYLQNQEQQISDLLGNIDNSIRQLKNDMDYLC